MVQQEQTNATRSDYVVKGTIGAAFYVGCILGSLIGGQLAERHGRKLSIATGEVLILTTSQNCDSVPTSATGTTITINMDTGI